MTMERVPEMWQASQGVGAEGDDPASATNVTLLSYDVDQRQSKTPRPDSKWPRLNGDDDGTNCLVNGLEMTVLSNLPGPDYALCVEPFVPFELLPREGLNQRLKDAVERAEHRQVSTSAAPAEHAPANTGPRSSIKKKRRRVSLQAAFGASRNLWEGISAAKRERRRPSDLVASPAPLLCAGKTGPGPGLGPAAADKERRLAGSGAAAAPLNSTKPNFLSDDSDTDSSCFSDEAASPEESKLQEDFHRKFHQELSRKLEFEQGGHNGRCIKVPELKLKRKACLPHWHCSNSIRVTTDRMSLGLPPEPMLPLHLPLDGVRLGGEPLTGNDSIPAGGETYALVSERAKDDDNDEFDSDSSMTCSSSDSDSDFRSPSCQRAHTFHRGAKPSPSPGSVPAGKLRGVIAGGASCNKDGNSKKQPEGRSRRAHLYLKPMLPREAVQRPAADDHSHGVGVGAGAGTRKAAQAPGRLSPWAAHRPVKVPQTPAFPAAPGAWLQQSGAGSSRASSRTSSRASSRAASPAAVPEAREREIRIGPWNSLSPRTELLGCAAPGGVGNVAKRKEQCGAFCFSIPLPGERSLLVRAETGPKQVHISVVLQDGSGEDGTLLAERDRVIPGQQQHGEQIKAGFSTPSGKQSAARKRSVSWSCPEILGPGVAPSAARPLSPVRSRDVPVTASPLSWSVPVHGGVRREPSPVSWNISVQGGAAPRTPSPSPPCVRPDPGEDAVADHGHADVTVPLPAETPEACPSATPAQDLARQHLEAVVVESSDGREHTVLVEPSDGREPSLPRAFPLSDQHPPAVQSLHGGKPGLVSYRNIEVQPGLIRDIVDCQNAATFQEVKTGDVAVAVPRGEQDDHGRRTSDLKFSKSSHNFLEKLARKAGSGDPHCVRALKLFQEEAEKENECEECEPQKCSRRCCRIGASQSHHIIVGAHRELSKEQVAAYSQTEKGIPSVVGRKHWLSLFKRAIRQKSEEFKAHV